MVIVGCSTATPEAWQPRDGGATSPPAGSPEAQPAISGVDDMARFLAGLPGGYDSKLNELRQLPGWQSHTSNLNELWRRFNILRREPIESWASRELGRLRSPRTLFYPFSGPDFLYADTIFPGAKNYVLCGLESSDYLPPLHELSPEEVQAGLDGIANALTSSLNFSFFITKDMKSDLQRSAFKGTLPILLVFLARTGHSVDFIEAVSLDANGHLVPRGAGSAPGFRIRFDGDRTLYYFTTNLANDSFSASSRFGRFVASLKPEVAFTKSASYLMHESYFSNIRNFLLTHTSAILQDDSGIPLKHFDPAKWDVTHYGNYSGVLDIFTKYYQPDLAEAHRLGAEPLGFGIGYKHQQGQSAMILARKR